MRNNYITKFSDYPIFPSSPAITTRYYKPCGFQVVPYNVLSTRYYYMVNVLTTKLSNTNQTYAYSTTSQKEIKLLNVFNIESPSYAVYNNIFNDIKTDDKMKQYQLEELGTSLKCYFMDEKLKQSGGNVLSSIGFKLLHLHYVSFKKHYLRYKENLIVTKNNNSITRIIINLDDDLVVTKYFLNILPILNLGEEWKKKLGGLSGVEFKAEKSG